MNKWINQLKLDIKSRPDFIFNTVLTSIFFALLLVLPVYDGFLKVRFGINDFSDHVMSAASATNLNIAARIDSYFLLLFGVMALLMIFFLLIYIRFNKYYKTGIDEKVKEFIRDSSFIGIAVILASIFTTNKDFAAYIIGIAVLLGWIFLSQKEDGKDFDMLVWSLLISASFAIFIYVMFMRYDFIINLSQNWIIQKLGLSPNLAFAILSWVLSIIGCHFIQQRFLNTVIINQFEKYKAAIIISGIPFLFTGIVQSISLEILNILNKNFNIVFNRPRVMYLVLMLLATIASILLYFLMEKRKISSFRAVDIIYKLYIPVTLISFVVMIAQPFRMTSDGNEFFEMANHGLSLDQFFRFGSIPIIESFDAHMMSNEIFAFLYSLINGYEPWAAFSYNNYNWLLYFIPMFYILRRLIGPMNSFFIILCFPLLTTLFNGSFILSGLVAICVIRMISSHKTLDMWLFWITTLFLCIYRLDLGFAALLGGISVYYLTCFVFKEKTGTKLFVLIGTFTYGIALLLFTLLCWLKGINPINRFMEFIQLCLSNQSWAYNSVGNSDMLAYVIGYYLLPLTALLCAFWVVIKTVVLTRNQKEIFKNSNTCIINKDAWIMSIFFTAFFIFNASRGIVRHSFNENTIIAILGTIPLAMVSFAVINKQSKLNMFKFLVAALALILVMNVNVTSYKGLGPSLISKAVTSQSYQEQYTPTQAFNGTRVKGPIMPSDAQSLKSILDTVLIPTETYFDFTSSNYFYALVGRKNPVYVNQSPLMISNDKTQDYALQQIKATKPPIILVPINGNLWSNIDGISVDYKYYMISEYIYQNYTPLIRLPMFDVYSLKEKKDIYLDELTKRGLLAGTIYDGSFDFVNKQRLSYNNSSGQIKNEGELDLNPAGIDPYTFGFMGQLREKYPKLKDNIGVSKPTQLKVEFDSKSAGRIQLFYTLNENEKFSEQQSKIITINAEGQNSAVLELPSMPYELRIDVDTQGVILKKLNISQGLQLINNQPEIWARNLGEIPRLWAEKDGNKEFLAAPQLQVVENNITSLTASTERIPSNEPMYLLLQIDSGAASSAKVDIEQSQSKLGEFNFTVSKGSHSYVIRLSTDYHWWNNPQKDIRITSSIPVNINKFCFISADSLKYYNLR